MTESATLVPTFLLACTHSYQNGGRISPLLAERRSIARLLEPAETYAACQLIQDDVSPRTNFLHLLEKHGFKEPVSVLHVCGTYQGAQSWNISELSASIGKLPDLQLVFLNGCSDLPLIEMLLLKDIPGVIATQTEVPDEELSEIAKSFYAEIGKGKSIEEAFEAVQSSFPGKLQHMKASYNLDDDCLDWEETSDTFISGLYTLAGNEDRLSWAIDVNEEDLVIEEENEEESSLNAEDLEEEPSATVEEIEEENSSKTPRRVWLVSAIIMICLLTSGAMVMSLHLNLKEQERWAESSLPPIGESLFQLVVLPFSHYRDCDEQASSITDAIFAQLKSMEAQTEHLAVNYGEYDYCNTFDLAKRLLKNERAQMIVWGDYHTDKQGDTLLSLHYGYLKADGSIQHTQLAAHSLSELAEPQIDGRHSHLQGISLQAMGIALFRQNEHKDAVSLLETAHAAGIKDHTLEKMLAISHNRMGTEFVQEKMEDKAWFHFSQALLYDEDLAEAYYNRGLINLKFKRLDDAVDDMKRVLSLSPEGVKPYGALAAIYASRGEDEAFYNYLEESLKAGIKMEQYIQYTAVKDYQDEDRFQELLTKYSVVLN